MKNVKEKMWNWEFVGDVLPFIIAKRNVKKWIGKVIKNIVLRLREIRRSYCASNGDFFPYRTLFLKYISSFFWGNLATSIQSFVIVRLNHMICSLTQPKRQITINMPTPLQSFSKWQNNLFYAFSNLPFGISFRNNKPQNISHKFSHR